MKTTRTLTAGIVILLSGTLIMSVNAQEPAGKADLEKPGVACLAPAAPPVVSQPVSVSDAVRIALQNNPRVSMQTAEVNEALARVGIAKSMTKLQVSTTTFATAGNMPNIISGAQQVEPQNYMRVPDTGQLDQNIMAMYPLYTGGLLSSRVRNAVSLSRAASSDVRSAELDVALLAKVAYRQVLLTRMFVDAYQRRVDESSERLRIAEAAYKEGKIAKFDLLRNQTELAEAKQQLINAQRDVEIALIDLKTVLGVSQDSDITLSNALNSAAVDSNLPGMRAQALTRRPEVIAAQARVQAAQASVSAAKSAYKPQVYAVGMQDFATSSRDGFDQGFTVGLTAAIPLVDGGRRKSEVNEAQAGVERMRAQEREVVLAVNKDVGTAWADLQAAVQNVGLAKAAVEQAEEDYRVIKLRYEAGKAINVEVLDALASLIRAQTNYAQALYEYNVAQDRLERAVGNI